MAGYNPYGLGYQPYYQAPMQQQLVGAQMSPAQMSGTSQAPTQMPPSQQGPSFALVNNEQEARDFVVLPGNSVFLMSRNDSVFWLKTTDQSGLSTPLRTFDYTERPQGVQAAQQRDDQYVTRDELEALAARVDALAAKKPPRAKDPGKEGPDNG